MNAPASKTWFKRLAVLSVALTGVGSAGWYYSAHFRAPTAAYQTSVVSRGEMRQIITASGQLNPLVKVEVGSQISGIIEKLFVDFNSTVKRGQVIAQLDPASYEASFIQAEGNLASAKAALEWAQINANRTKALRADKLNPQADYDKALSDLHQAEAAVKINEGALKKAQVDLARCTIYAPIDGTVISRNVDVGQTVAASLSAPVLFLIANDLSKMQIQANVAEADVGLVELGQAIEFTVDAFRGKIFHGKVSQIRNAPKTDQNVVTYDTMIDVSNADLKLKPGMTANVSIIVAQREKALRVPNAALRFHPPENSVAKKVQASAEEPNSGDKGSRKSGHKKDKKKMERIVYLSGNSSGPTNSAPRGTREPALLEPQQIKTGITDGTYTEVLDGLQEGDEVVTSLASAKGGLAQTVNPFASSRKRP